jgi:uncharacterized protein
MRIYDHILPVALLSLGLGVTTAHALDGTKSPDNIPGMPGVGVGPQAPIGTDPTNLKSWWDMKRAGDTEGAVKALERAFRNGDVGAGWELGRMYADGDGVKQDDLRAFEYFRAVAENQRNEDATGRRAAFVARAYVSLGLYYLNGIGNSNIKPDPVRAQQTFIYAATNFGDPDAQYQLGRAYLDGQGVAKDPKQAARWLYLAAMKGQYEAQAMFGSLLFKGQVVARDGAKGLMWLKLAVDSAPSGAPGIKEVYTAAWKQATDDERAAALVHLEHWKEHSGHQ